MGLWLWLNIPLAAAFFLAWSGIPLWLVLRHPDTGPDAGPGSSRHDRAPGPATTTGMPAHPGRRRPGPRARRPLTTASQRAHPYLADHLSVGRSMNPPTQRCAQPESGVPR